MKNRYGLALLAVALLNTETLYARAGGGGAARGIGTIVGLIYMAILVMVIRKKNKKAKKQIDSIHNIDPFWDFDSIIALAQDVFSQMQVAWGERDMDLVKELVTDSLYINYKKQLDWKKVTHEKNIIEDIEIKKVRIIGDDENPEDKSKDRLTVYIYGKMVDYAIDDRTGKKLFDRHPKQKPFSDLYYFVRQDDKWLLNKIDNRVTLTKVLREKQRV